MPPRKRKTSFPEVHQNHLLLTQVQRTLAVLPETDSTKDAGLRRLAEVYAAAIDEALDVALNAKELVEKANDPEDEFDVPRRVLNALVKFSDSTTTLEQLGPKLQAALESLGASPKARAQMTGKGGGNADVPAGGQSTFAQRRAAAAAREQAARANGSSAMDSSA